MATLNLERVGIGPHEEKKSYEFGLHANIRESKHRILSAVGARLDHYGVTSGGSC